MLDYKMFFNVLMTFIDENQSEFFSEESIKLDNFEFKIQYQKNLQILI